MSTKNWKAQPLKPNPKFGNQLYSAIIDESGKPVGFFYPCTNFAEHREAGEVNSCLIAAAPELLAALKQILYIAEAPSGAGIGECKMSQNLIDSARAAIAKATS